MITRRITLAFALLAAAALQVVHAAGEARPEASAIALLVEDRLPTLERYRERLATHGLRDLSIEEKRRDGSAEAFVLAVDDGFALVLRGNSPLDAQALRLACVDTFNDEQVCEAAKDHGGHAAVILAGTGLDPVDAHLLHTRLVSALLDDNVIGVYRGGMLHARPVYEELARDASREAPPVWLWVDMRISRTEEGVSMSTFGLSAFGLNEIETRNVDRPPAEVFDLVLGMAAYLVTKGDVIEDGDTVGASAADDIRVRRAPSYWHDGQTVYRVFYP